MLQISLVLIFLWIISLIHQQKTSDKYKWVDTPISNYIKHSRKLQFGFILLGLQFVFQGIFFYSFSQIQAYLFIQSGIGQLGVMLTKHEISSTPHFIQAGLTYIGQFVACVIIGHLTNGILLGLQIQNILYQIFQVIIRDELGDVERYLALGIITWIIQFLLLV